MSEQQRTYIAIDLKSFYASVECVDRGFDPLTTNLVVADVSRTEKTICLAVSPSLKAYGIGGRARLFEVVQRVREVNNERKRSAGWRMTGKSYNDPELKANPSLELDYIAAPPRMAHYMEVSTKVYETYLKYIAPNRKMELIVSMLPEHPSVTIEYFVPDRHKAGGSYQSYTGNVKRIDEYEKHIEFTDGKKAPLDVIREIKID